MPITAIAVFSTPGEGHTLPPEPKIEASAGTSATPSQDSPMEKNRRVEENYRRFETDDRVWDVKFWQMQGSAAIFDAVWGMILDRRLLTESDATEPRLQRTLEYFGEA